MNDFIKWSTRMLVSGVFWVFFLSISVSGRSLFSYANDFFVQNTIVQYIDEELADLWDKIARTAEITFSEMGEVDEKV